LEILAFIRKEGDNYMPIPGERKKSDVPMMGLYLKLGKKGFALFSEREKLLPKYSTDSRSPSPKEGRDPNHKLWSKNLDGGKKKFKTRRIGGPHKLVTRE